MPMKNIRTLLETIIIEEKDRKLSDLDDDRVIHINDDLIVYKPAAGESVWAAYFIDKAKNVILGKKGTKAEVKAFADKEKMK